ncbi:DUF3800 domain-containing protein [Lactobacillus pasteurii]|uniref:DUF3800 domain-containing protein n=1 Tax=Lactobacillus pasteurii DSM 23907 = CRBIP 24.76 TaxID=1423790 RepID=I7JXJ6_9LACO|nr:DUF3800 domain-containing protein [Lactobacillus pasteurii]TDG77696.1 hypothetical protein C5L33_000107 [Lactobacillus pasteurii]CCI84695.1 Putative uncharacterized protein [Lactobacillus pasteurii DSM 23907 = CRBIP 24.76]
MEIFIYSDESGVFDNVHNEVFVFGGVFFLSREEKDIATRKYRHVESIIRKKEDRNDTEELKAAKLSPTTRNKIYRSLNNLEKFGVIIHQQRILGQIFKSKKSKRRYLDYAYKIALKRKFEQLILNKTINPNKVTAIYIFADERSVAKDERNELKETLEEEFKDGRFNETYSKFFAPMFPNLRSIEVSYCNSAKVTLVRTADVVANRLYRSVAENDTKTLSQRENFCITHLP